MVNVPAFLLKRLYVKQSLRNEGDGFKFEFKNTLGSGFGIDISPLVIDGQEIPKEKSYFSLDSQERPFTSVSKESPFTLPMNTKVVIMVKGMTVPPGAHKISFSFVAQGLGKLGFEFSDTIS
jgi:hypothetical protein